MGQPPKPTVGPAHLDSLMLEELELIRIRLLLRE